MRGQVFSGERILQPICHFVMLRNKKHISLPACVSEYISLTGFPNVTSKLMSPQKNFGIKTGQQMQYRHFCYNDILK